MHLIQNHRTFMLRFTHTLSPSFPFRFPEQPAFQPFTLCTCSGRSSSASSRFTVSACRFTPKEPKHGIYRAYGYPTGWLQKHFSIALRTPDCGLCFILQQVEIMLRDIIFLDDPLFHIRNLHLYAAFPAPLPQFHHHFFRNARIC